MMINGQKGSLRCKPNRILRSQTLVSKKITAVILTSFSASVSYTLDASDVMNILPDPFYSYFVVSWYLHFHHGHLCYCYYSILLFFLTTFFLVFLQLILLIFLTSITLPFITSSYVLRMCPSQLSHLSILKSAFSWRNSKKWKIYYLEG